MEKTSLSSNDLANLKDLFQENYLIIKQTKEYEKKVVNNELRLFLKQIRNDHEEILINILKLLDEKERIIW